MNPSSKYKEITSAKTELMKKLSKQHAGAGKLLRRLSCNFINDESVAVVCEMEFEDDKQLLEAMSFMGEVSYYICPSCTSKKYVLYDDVFIICADFRIVPHHVRQLAGTDAEARHEQGQGRKLTRHP